jgi:hypothetical protein
MLDTSFLTAALHDAAARFAAELNDNGLSREQSFPVG